MLLCDMVFLIFSILLCAYIIIDFILNIKNEWQEKIIFRWSQPLAIALLVVIVISTVSERYIAKRDINYVISLVGIILFLTAFLLRIWSKKSLGQYYSSHIQVKNNHRIVENGPYKIMRHPYYFSIIIGALSFPLIVNAYFSFCLALITIVPLIVIRCYIEEAMLLQRFGNQYRKYMEKTKLFSNREN